MVAVWRKAIQEADDEVIRKRRNGNMPLIKADSLNERARKLSIATDMPAINRMHRRKDLKTAVREERIKVI